MKRVTVRSGRADLAVTTAGEGPALVFLHAGVADKRMWRAQMTEFATTHTVVAYDGRGFGETTCEAEDHARTGDLDAVLAAATSGRVVLVGCSQGGRIAVDYALTHPARVAAMVLVAPAISGAPEIEKYPPSIQSLVDETQEAETAGDLDRLNALEAHAWLDGPLSRKGRVTGPARDLFLDMNARALRAPPPGDDASNTNAYARFAELKLPILFVSSELDFPHINERSAYLSRLAPDAALVELKGLAHLPNLEQPLAFNTILRDFLAGLDISPP